MEIYEARGGAIDGNIVEGCTVSALTSRTSKLTRTRQSDDLAGRLTERGKCCSAVGVLTITTNECIVFGAERTFNPEFLNKNLKPARFRCLTY